MFFVPVKACVGLSFEFGMLGCKAGADTLDYCKETEPGKVKGLEVPGRGTWLARRREGGCREAIILTRRRVERTHSPKLQSLYLNHCDPSSPVTQRMVQPLGELNEARCSFCGPFLTYLSMCWSPQD